MPDSFFASSKPRKRKRLDVPHSNKKTPQKYGPDSKKLKVNGLGRTRKRLADEELSDKTDEDGGGIDDLDLRGDRDEEPEGSGDEDDNETPAKKRLRLAKLYLESVKVGLADGEYDAAEIDKELVASRLKQDVLEHSGKVHLFIADSFDFSNPPMAVLRTKGHRLSVTSAIASESAKYMFTSGKEGSIIKWDLKTGKRLTTFHKIRSSNEDKKGKGKVSNNPDIRGHTDEVLSLALSGDGKWLASAGRDRRVGIWDAEKDEWIKGFIGQLGHKDAISNVAFKKGSNQLYSGSFDRTVKVYDMTPSVMGYVETLFGHQDHVLGLDALKGDTCVTVGGRDKTVRYWKIIDETQLVFRGGGRSRIREVLEGGLRGDDEGDDVDVDGAGPSAKGQGRETKKIIEGSLECVAMIDETTFVSGGDSGSICLWTTLKKKPIFTQPVAHGFNEVASSTEGLIQTPRWITALASLWYSDIMVSGSWDGDVRIWKVDSKLKSFSLIGTVAAPGVVNSLQLLTPPRGFLDDASWAIGAGTAQHILDSSRPNRKDGTNPMLLVAGLGQEHRFGRWLNVKEGGAVNGTVTALFSPRTL